MLFKVIEEEILHSTPMFFYFGKLKPSCKHLFDGMLQEKIHSVL